MGEKTRLSFRAMTQDDADVIAEIEEASFAMPSNLKMPRASSVAICAEASGKVDNVMNLEPLYIRRSEAEELWEKRHGLISEQ